MLPPPAIRDAGLQVLKYTCRFYTSKTTVLTALKAGKPSGTDQKGGLHTSSGVTLHVHVCTRRFYISKMTVVLIMFKIIAPR